MSEGKPVKVLSHIGVRMYVKDIDPKKRFQQDFWASLESVVKDVIEKIVVRSEHATLTGEDAMLTYRAYGGDVLPGRSEMESGESRK